MRASELMQIWRSFGLKKQQEIHTFLGAVLEEHGDYETRTTPELIQASVRCEMDGITFMPIDPTCTSCNDKEECDKDWVDGHRFNWFICANCHRVMPCAHGLLVHISEQDLKGTCSTCCMRMPHSFVAEYLRKMYADKAAWFGRCAESIRKQEQEEREFIINFPNVETMPVTPGLEENWGL